jgi:hypothetical protein
MSNGGCWIDVDRLSRRQRHVRRRHCAAGFLSAKRVSKGAARSEFGCIPAPSIIPRRWRFISGRDSAPDNPRLDGTAPHDACSGCSSCPDLIRASIGLHETLAKEMDGRVKPGHDELYRSGEEPARADQLTLRIAEKPRSAAAAAFPRCQARRLVRIAMPSRLDSRASGCAATDRAFDARA